ncbi:KCND2 [Branchiostoma lanceolatum]|uniref:KCND2 protein n=1 Tax=Branchiostoma lanceolatum TaxID=7740 RepID=A0A8J9ZLL7_BRALA|nr:KCND2 [Branchiostoma lanceolatum]
MAGLSFFEYPDIQDDEKGNRDTVLPEKQRLLQRRRSISTSLTKRLLSFSVHGGRVNSIRRVVFNVSGTRFVAWEDQLDRLPHTLLGSPSHRQVYYDADNKEYKFDRCPKVFKHILMYYRTGVLHLSDDVCLSTFREDLEFFRISLDESLGTCCYETYQTIRDNVLKDPSGEVNPDHTRSSHGPTTLRQRMWQVFQDVPGSAYGSAFKMVVGYFIAITVISNIVETVSCGDRYFDSCDKVYPWIFECTEMFDQDFDYIGESDCDEDLREDPNTETRRLIRRKCSISHRQSVHASGGPPCSVRRLVLNVSGTSLVTGKNDSITPLFRSFRGFRILRLGASTQRLKLLLLTLRECISQLMDILFAMLLFVIVGATLMFYVENSTNDGFSSIPDVFWYVIVTMMSVGYGDAVPHTTIGMVLGGLCSIFGVILVAIPLTIIGTTFSRVCKRSQVRQN